MTEIGTGIVIVIELLTKLHAAVKGGGDVPVHHHHPTKGAAGALRNGENILRLWKCSGERRSNTVLSLFDCIL